MSRSTPRYVWAALDAAKARRARDEAERVALAERDDDVGGEMSNRDWFDVLTLIRSAKADPEEAP